MRIDFKNKTIIVTGGESGIGQEIAELFLNMNAIVYVTGISTIPQWCKKYNNCIFLPLNLLDIDSINSFLIEITNLEIDILINNAGIQIQHIIDDIDINDWNKVIAVNLDGPMRIIQAIAPKMMNAKKGKILNISSIAGIISKPKQSSYSATKAGLIGLTKAVALDLAPYNILVNALCPGTTQTAMVEAILTKEQKQSIINNVPLKRLATVREIANFAVFLCSDLNTYITGQSIVVDGGFTIQ
jgi:3-oxoacyl-[acyl-carrier protein] reductase